MSARPEKQAVEKLLDTVKSFPFEDKLWLKQKLDLLVGAETRKELENSLVEGWEFTKDIPQERIEEEALEAVQEYRRTQKG